MRPSENTEEVRANGDEKRTKDCTWSSPTLRGLPTIAHGTHVQDDYGIVWRSCSDQ